MRRFVSLALLAALVPFSLAPLAGCTPEAKPGDTATTGGTAKPDSAKKLKVGIVFDKGGLGDKSFNDSAWAGIQKAEAEFGIEVSKVESKEEKDYETNLAAMADKGLDLVIAVGLNQGKALQKVAADYPDTKFAIVDGDVKADNVRMLTFNEEEGSFLVGYLAGLMSKTGKLGFVGGMELDLIKKFQYGYMAGAKTANKSIEVLPAKYIGNWDNIDQAKAAANVLFNGGADVVYHAAGRAGLGVIRAAQERKAFAIGVDSDQDGEAEGFVLTSMIKRVDQAVFSTIKDLEDNKFTPGEIKYKLSDKGVGVTEMRFTKDKVGEANLAKLKEIEGKIVHGEIAVPNDLSSYDTYMASLK